MEPQPEDSLSEGLQPTRVSAPPVCVCGCARTALVRLSLRGLCVVVLLVAVSLREYVTLWGLWAQPCQHQRVPFGVSIVRVSKGTGVAVWMQSMGRLSA